MVTGKILSFDQAANGNILINVEYTLADSSKVLNPYHAKLENFWNKTVQEVTDWIKAQVEYQCENYLEDYVDRMFVQEQVHSVMDLVVAANPGAIAPTVVGLPEPVLNLTSQKRSVENGKMINGTLSGLIGLTYSRDKVIYKITAVGYPVTEQLHPDLMLQHSFVKQVEIAQDKSIVVRDI